jgi:hypothetical protein
MQMAIKELILKSFDSRQLIVYLSSPSIDITKEFANDIHKIMAPYGNMIFFTYDHLIKPNLLSNLIPDECFSAFSKTAYYTDAENSIKDFFITKDVREAIVKELRSNLYDNFVNNGFNPSSIIFVAHGLGSVVVWDYLKKYRPCFSSVRSIFMGSPLYLNIPWTLVDRKFEPYKASTYAFSGTRDLVCFNGKRKRDIGVEYAAHKLSHSPIKYIEYVSGVNSRLENLWMREI